MSPIELRHALDRYDVAFARLAPGHPRSVSVPAPAPARAGAPAQDRRTDRTGGGR